MASFCLVLRICLLWFVSSAVADITTFDCPMRSLALEFSQHIQPQLTSDQLQDIADALNGSPEAQNCNISVVEIKKTNPPMLEPSLENEAIFQIFVSAENGNNVKNDGLSIGKPVKTIEHALNIIRKYRSNEKIKPKAIIKLRKGIYYLRNTLEFTSEDSNLMITNFNNEESIISGAIPLYNCTWKLYQNTSDKFNIYSLDLRNSLTLQLNNYSTFDGLRVNGTRAIRARYPNAIPETDGFGSDIFANEWFPPSIPVLPEIEIYDESYPVRNTTANNEFMFYQLGIGGICSEFDPPAGYWCGTNVEGGGASTYQVPNGFTFNQSILPNTPYKNTSGGIVSVWHPSHWANWFFEIGTHDSSSINFTRGGFQGARGSTKGGEFYIENIFEELDSRHEWFYNQSTFTLYYYSNLTDMQPNCDQNNGRYLFEITHLKTLMNFNGNQSSPIKNVTIEGIIFQDSSFIEFDSHIMPSGGDWSIARIGTIIIEGCKDFNISYNTFLRNDGNAIVLNRFNRYIYISYNEFVWNGDTCIALIGDTKGITVIDDDGSVTNMGWDGRNGNQPRYIFVTNNIAHEFGIWEKQSSFYFQSQSCLNVISNNVIYNGPRAGINFNDGFGGGSQVTGNLVFNMCRESGDHGPFNSWDRQPYITQIYSGHASTMKLFDVISYNFMIGNYNTQDVIDNDDGSCYYRIFSNLLVYGPNGQKSDAGGHDIHSYDNIYAYIFVHPGWDWSGPTSFHDFTTQLSGHTNYYYNNTCVLCNGSDVGAISVGYAKWVDCDDGGIVFNSSRMEMWTVMYDNRIFVENGSLGLCDMTENQFQQSTGLDLGTKVYGYLPDDDALLMQAKQMLWNV